MKSGKKTNEHEKKSEKEDPEVGEDSLVIVAYLPLGQKIIEPDEF